MPKIVPAGAAVGNTITTAPRKCDDNPKTKWFFTWNNYIEKDISLFVPWLNENCKKFIVQEEIGEKCKTPHLQGSLILLKKKRFSNLHKLWIKVHWEPTIAKNGQDLDYCCKDETRKPDGRRWQKGIELPLMPALTIPRKWQQTILDMCNQPADKRSINWLWDKDGNIGKTTLANYMYDTLNCIVCDGGKKADICQLIRTEKEKNNRCLNNNLTILLDLCRDIDHISYDAIESCKNGRITSTKFDSCTIRFNTPHIWVFSNHTPNLSKMSMDRWKIWVVVNDKLMEEEVPE